MVPNVSCLQMNLYIPFLCTKLVISYELWRIMFVRELLNGPKNGSGGRRKHG